MDRRDSIKSLLTGSLAGGIVISGCSPDIEQKIETEPEVGDYGRTPEEKELDARLKAEQFLNDHELTTIAVLCDLILPSSGENGSANDAGVPEFIDFIVKDMPKHQTPIRGGLMWLDNHSNSLFNREFASCTQAQQKTILDEIAYPEKAKAEVGQGVKFFTMIRKLVLTGYYTTRLGIDELAYKGNMPNFWDGVPEEILKEHNVAYEKEMMPKYIAQDNSFILAKWDDEGNLIS